MLHAIITASSTLLNEAAASLTRRLASFPWEACGERTLRLL